MKVPLAGSRLCCLLLVFSVFLVSACSESGKPSAIRKIISGGREQELDTAAFAAAMQEAVGTVDDSELNAKLPDVSSAIRIIYNARGFSPVWLDGNGKPTAATLFADLKTLPQDGLPASRYAADSLEAAGNALGDASADALVAWDTACTRAYLQASRDLLLGTILPRRADSLWFHANDSSWTAYQSLKRRESSYVSLDSSRSKLAAYSTVRTAYQAMLAAAGQEGLRTAKAEITASEKPDTLVERIVTMQIPDWKSYQPDTLAGRAGMIGAYQAFCGVRVTGKLDSATKVLLARPADSFAKMLGANLERLRWLPKNLEDRYVLVNIPMMELRYNQDGTEDFRMRVVVGKPSRQTPSLNASMANIVFNPPWGVPPTILKKDVLPGVLRSGGGYLARKGLHAYDRNGNEVSASRINLSNYRSYSFRQPPGARNALGEVKFNLPNRWDIYLHDTPHREDFPKRNRALSSGCIRVQRPKEFAEFILTELEDKEQFTPSKIDSIISTRKTRYETLQRRIPVHIVYLTADDDGGKIRLFEDVYRRDRKLMAMLPQ